jgi:DNA mismatch repair protein PMS2
MVGWMLMKNRPQFLELTAADELLAIENIEMLRQNGFEVGEVDDLNTGLGHRLQLVARPVSKGTDFDMKGVIFLVCPVHK